MEASAFSSSTLLCSSALGLRPCRSLNHASGRLLLVPRSSADCSLVWLSSSSIRLSLSQRIDVVAPSAVSGSADVETSAISKDAADLLDEVEVFDLNGNAVPVSDLWKDRKAVVAFARHFGCVLCRKRADYLASKKDRMDASGVALVLIGPGSTDQRCMQIQITHHMMHYDSHTAFQQYLLLELVLRSCSPTWKVTDKTGSSHLKNIQFRRVAGSKVESLLQGRARRISHTSTGIKKPGTTPILRKSYQLVVREGRRTGPLFF